MPHLAQLLLIEATQGLKDVIGLADELQGGEGEGIKKKDL